MTDKKLFEEFRAYDQMINDIGCYGVRDMLYYTHLYNEVEERGLDIRYSMELVEE